MNSSYSLHTRARTQLRGTHAHSWKRELAHTSQLNTHPQTHTHTPVQAVLVVDGGLEPVDGEGDNAGEDGGPAVDEGNNDGLALKVVVVLVVAGKRYERPEAQAQREEDLSGRVDPRGGVGELFQLKADRRTDELSCNHTHTNTGAKHLTTVTKHNTAVPLV